MTSTSQGGSPAAEQLTFEQALGELEQVVHELEEGRVGLSEALSRYEQGVRLLKRCHGLLEAAQRRIELLTGIDADGNPITEPFDDQATISVADNAPARSRRRSTARKPTAEGESTAACDDDPQPGSLF